MDESPTPTTAPARPIGYWLVRLDRLIEAAFDRALAAHNLSRREWQVVNTLARGRASHAELAAAVAPFLSADRAGELDASEIDSAVVTMVGRGWATRRDLEGVELTAAGIDAHARILLDVDRMRGAMTIGVTREEYGSTIDVLRRMAANLENDAAASTGST